MAHNYFLPYYITPEFIFSLLVTDESYDIEWSELSTPFDKLSSLSSISSRKESALLF
jgi:hypothetical protein